MSAGGYCALNLLVRHSQEFAAALDMSGYTMPTHSGGLRALFGRSWPAARAANTPATFLAHHRLWARVLLRFDVGRDDITPQRELAQLAPRLLNAGVSLFVVRRAGGHTYHVWAPALRSGTSWLAGALYRAGTSGPQVVGSP